MFKPMPNFKTTIPFIVNLQVYEHSAKLLACIHVIQCMIEHYCNVLRYESQGTLEFEVNAWPVADGSLYLKK